VLRGVLKIYAKSWGVPLKAVIELWEHGYLQMVKEEDGVSMAMSFPGEDEVFPLSLGLAKPPESGTQPS
jgi:hypothetical protein